jgi:hypothetical protein
VRVVLRAVRNGLPIEQALDALEEALDGQEKAWERLEWLLQEALRVQPEEPGS